MKEIVFATNNAHKIKEVSALLGQEYRFLSLRDIGCTEELEESRSTLEGNAIQKAAYVFNTYGKDCFSEDTGLEIKALNGAPGVITAHYAGPERDNQANMKKVLFELDGITEREAQFRTIIALIINDRQQLFEGIVKGRIALQQSGKAGFGYDPIFIPTGYDGSFAEMDAQAKNAISHRGKAIQKLMAFLQQNA